MSIFSPLAPWLYKESTKVRSNSFDIPKCYRNVVWLSTEERSSGRGKVNPSNSLIIFKCWYFCTFFSLKVKVCPHGQGEGRKEEINQKWTPTDKGRREGQNESKKVCPAWQPFWNAFLLVVPIYSNMGVKTGKSRSNWKSREGFKFFWKNELFCNTSNWSTK